MSSFAQFQHKRVKTSSSVEQSAQILQPSGSIEPPKAAPVSEQTSPVDWRAEVEHATRFGHSIARLAIHNPTAPHQETFAQEASAPTGQNATMDNQASTLQRKGEAVVADADSDVPARQENHTGLPDGLKAGVETLSGLSLNDVQVHYNSSKPSEVQALAYTQGTEIHVGPGQEQYLAHEAWHVVQQKQGRVQPTLQAMGVAINDDKGLEREAEVMGERAQQVDGGSLQRKAEDGADLIQGTSAMTSVLYSSILQGYSLSAPIQRVVVNAAGESASVEDVKQYIEDEDLNVTLDDDTLESELEAEEAFDEEIEIIDFLQKIGVLDEDMDEGDEDEDWDPADFAADPMEPDDILKSDVRASLAFNMQAKAWMKADTPKDAGGAYLCHICKKKILKGQDIDQDHLPPWRDRLEAFILTKGLTEDDADELTGPLMKGLYNMRGSVFAHSSCNRSHKGEDNYKKKWGNAAAWFGMTIEMNALKLLAPSTSDASTSVCGMDAMNARIRMIANGICAALSARISPR